MRQGLFRTVILASAIFASPPAGAHPEGQGDDEDDCDRAMELHRAEKWDQAATGFIHCYQRGDDEEKSAYNAACALARAGRRDEAFRWLETAYQAGFSLENYLDDDDDLRSLRSDPRFADLQARVTNGRPTRKQREGERLAQRYHDLRNQEDATPDKLNDIGRALLNAGRYDEATKAFLRAARREEFPAASIYNAACARARHEDKGTALDLLQLAVEQGFADPDHIDKDDDLDTLRDEPRFRQIRALAQELEVPGYPSQQRDRNPRARAEWQAAFARIEAAARNHPQLGQVWFNLAFAYLTLGHPEQAIAPFQRAVDLGYRRNSSTYNTACALAMSAHPDEAFRWLEAAVQGGFENWSSLQNDEDLDNLRSDPRFRRYLELARSHQHD